MSSMENIELSQEQPQREIYSVAKAIKISALLVTCTLLGLAGTDLVLPAIPTLPEQLNGSVSMAQFVLAAFAAGTGLGLIMFGELGARFNQARLLLLSMSLYAVFSFLASRADDLGLLVFLRFLQGMSCSCAAVIAPGMIRAMFSEQQALRAIGVLGSVESLAPAIAPLVGVWLLSQGNWQLSFQVTAALALILALIVGLMQKAMPKIHRDMSDQADEIDRLHAGYLKLIRNRDYMSQALSHALVVGGLLVFVFGAPAVIVRVLDGDIMDFILMQAMGIFMFIICANLASNLATRYGSVRVIWMGSLLSTLGILSLLLYALLGGREPMMLWLMFIPFNMGLGFRGPPAFYETLVATQGDDARGSALMILMIMLITATGTALVAPWLQMGLVPLCTASFLILTLSLLSLWQNPTYRGSSVKAA